MIIMRIVIASCFSVLVPILSQSCNYSNKLLNENLENIHSSMTVTLSSFKNAKIESTKNIPLEDLLYKEITCDFENTKLLVSLVIENQTTANNSFKLSIKSKLIEGELSNFSLGLNLELNSWSEDNYVLFPGSVYAGNRFYSVKKVRGVHVSSVLKEHPDVGPIITNVPRLNIEKNASLLQQLSGDMSTPCVTFRFADQNEALFIQTSQGNKWGDYSFALRENAVHDSASLCIRMPGIREDSVFKGGGQPFFPSSDQGANLVKGDEVILECMLDFRPAEDIPKLFDHYIELRNTDSEDELPPQIPYSAAWSILEDKFNRQNWVPEYGYYSVGMRESMYQDWQTGWTGGMNAVYPLLALGADSTFENAIRTFDFLFDTISPSGLLYEIFYNGQWRLKEGSSFLRRNSDALYFIVKSFNLIQERKPDFSIPDHWEDAARGCANAFISLWEKYHDFGQWADYETGNLTAAGTTGNGIAPAALCLFASYIDETSYLAVAEESAEYYYRNYILKGYTSGGPGDIYQNIDSESAFGLLESFIVLYEKTKNEKWLQYAEDAANLCSSWVVSYNFNFPEGSTFQKMGMNTKGTVIANCQNKHAAPGICTLSGNSLFKLYRYTGKKVYLDLIRDIKFTIPQYMSRADRPIADPRPGVQWPLMPPGWINERVNMSDWEERGNTGDIKRGEIFSGSTWSEVAFMNSHAELPGLYILMDQQEVTVLDNLTAEFTDKNEIIITNPTPFSGITTLLIETSDQRQNILSPAYLANCRRINVQAMSTVRVQLSHKP